MDYGRQIAEVIDAAHKNDVVEIHSMGEPFDFDQIEWKGTKFLDILRNICKENNWPLEKFCIFSNNLLQSDATWPKIKKAIYIKPFLYGSFVKKEAKKTITKHFGIFINNSSWPRLWLSSYLFSKYGKTTLQSFVRDLKNPSHAANLDLDALIFNFSEAKLIDHMYLNNICNFLFNAPLIIGHKNTNCQTDQHFNTDFPTDSDLSPMTDALLNSYDSIFCDVVCETMFSGKVFSIDEKISRCFIMKTPFLIFGGKNQLSNLKKLGFKTFSNYWDESYDYCSDALRCVEMSKVIEHLSKKSINEINEMYRDMETILNYNKSLYLDLCSRTNLSAYLNSIKF